MGQGEKQASVALRLGVSKDCIYRLAKEFEIPSYESRGQISAARRDYFKQNRIDLCNKGFDKLEDMLPIIQEPQKMYQWSLAFGILTDKRLLEDGKSAGETETDSDSALNELTSKLDEIEEKRRQRAN